LDPAIRITKLTTIASTGRLMKMSVKDFMAKIRTSTSEIRNKPETQNANYRLYAGVTRFYSLDVLPIVSDSCFEFSVRYPQVLDSTAASAQDRC
jgi:hypothetical protein